MDFQEEREVFEQLPEIEMVLQENPDIKFENGGYIYYGLNQITALSACYVGGAWMAWQAKAQAVPDNSLSRLKKQIAAHYDRINDVMHEEGYNDKSFGQLMALDFIEEVIDEMIEAQEPTND